MAKELVPRVVDMDDGEQYVRVSHAALLEACVEAADAVLEFYVDHRAWCVTGHGPGRQCDCLLDETRRTYDAARAALRGEEAP